MKADYVGPQTELQEEKLERETEEEGRVSRTSGIIVRLANKKHSPLKSNTEVEFTSLITIRQLISPVSDLKRANLWDSACVVPRVPVVECPFMPLA